MSPKYDVNLNVDFEPLINYESIVCARFPDSFKNINAACMGVHFTSNKEVYIHAYEGTHTREILSKGATFSINFSEDFYEYVIAGLKTTEKDERIDELPPDSFRKLDIAPILKSAWCAVICKTIPMSSTQLQKPECKRRQEPNIRAKILTIKWYRLPRIFNNRAKNLALEALIYATRIPLYEKLSNQYNESLKNYIQIKKKLIDWRDMDRFEAGFEAIDNFLINRNVKAQDLFDL